MQMFRGSKLIVPTQDWAHHRTHTQTKYNFTRLLFKKPLNYNYPIQFAEHNSVGCKPYFKISDITQEFVILLCENPKYFDVYTRHDKQKERKKER